MKKSIFWVGGVILLGVIVALILIFSLRKPSYEVSFMSDGVEVMDSIKVKEDGTVEEPKTPVKEGYDFVGWYSGTEKFDFSTKITEDITLEAKWVKEGATTYIVTFDSKGGNNIASMTVEMNSTINPLPTPLKEGYKFVGWYFGSQKFTTNTKVMKNIELIAKWEKEETTTTKKKTTKKKTTTTTKTTATTTTTTTTTTKVTTTSKKVEKDEISYDIIPVEGSTVGEAKLYLFKNGKKVSGTCVVSDINGATATISVPINGYDTNVGEFQSVTNIKVN